uniref:NADH dehydrogenase subunit 6 n=1 Tax=Batracobdella cancricola TaxID=3027018 RepID=UPI0023D7E378|nr:NADH dehydrogenase subunit 6 [Batracobdella cancricola]WDA96154.1 NADH dehydrogenase subunit 6 [Batracobdella cancricola]
MSLFMMNILMSMFLTMMTLKTPAMMVFNILMMALVTAWIYAFTMSSWYSFLIYLIYIGGMLIMFAYFVALSPNQHLKIKLYSTTFILTFFMLMIPSVVIKNMFIIHDMYAFYTDDLYLDYNIPMLFFMILLLLFMMLVIVKMINMSKGPLRPFS